MAQRFELGFDHTADGRLSLHLNLLANNSIKPSKGASEVPQDLPHQGVTFKRTTQEIVSFVERLAHAAENDQEDATRAAEEEFKTLQRQSRPEQEYDEDEEGGIVLLPLAYSSAAEVSQTSPGLQNRSPSGYLVSNEEETDLKAENIAVPSSYASDAPRLPRISPVNQTDGHIISSELPTPLFQRNQTSGFRDPIKHSRNASSFKQAPLQDVGGLLGAGDRISPIENHKHPGGSRDFPFSLDKPPKGLSAEFRRIQRLHVSDDAEAHSKAIADSSVGDAAGNRSSLRTTESTHDDPFPMPTPQKHYSTPSEPSYNPSPQSPPNTPRYADEIIIPRLRKAHARVRDRVEIDVGGRIFIASADILEESGLLKKAIAQRAFASANDTSTATIATATTTATKSDGSSGQPIPTIRVENDPDLFAEVLKYLRTGLFPLYWDRHKGFDHARYADMAAQARVYRIPKLERWIRSAGYLDVVSVETVHRETRLRKSQRPCVERNLNGNAAARGGGDREIRVDAVLTDSEAVWTCPARNEDHEADSAMCEIEGCCGDLMESSARKHPEQRVKVDVVRIFTTERIWSVNERLLRSWNF